MMIPGNHVYFPLNQIHTPIISVHMELLVHGVQQKLIQMATWAASMASAILHAQVGYLWDHQMLVELVHWDQARSLKLSQCLVSVSQWTTAAVEMMIAVGKGVLGMHHLNTVFHLGQNGS